MPPRHHSNLRLQGNRTGPLRLVLACLLCVGAGSNAESVLAGLPPRVTQGLDAEGFVVLEDSGAGSESSIVAYVVFRQPRPVVIELLRQAERQLEYRPELDGVETVERTPDGRIDEQSIRVVFTRLVYRLRYREELEKGRFEWALDPGFDNDLERLAGFWELTPFDGSGRTLGRFGSSLDVGPAVPAFIQDRMSRRTVFRYLRNCRQWIDSQGEWRP